MTLNGTNLPPAEPGTTVHYPEGTVVWNEPGYPPWVAGPGGMDVTTVATFPLGGSGSGSDSDDADDGDGDGDGN
jgi:hypothetical protein